MQYNVTLVYGIVSPKPWTGVPVLPLYIHLYFDGFGLYRRKYHSTNGMYFALGNMPRSEGAKKENIGTVGLGEPGLYCLLNMS